MWIPTPIYERIPQFWFLLGLLFFATGLYLGFEFALSFWYLAVGVACCSYGAGIFLVRLAHRGSPKAAQRSAVAENSREEAAPVEVEPAESPYSEPAHAE